LQSADAGSVLLPHLARLSNLAVASSAWQNRRAHEVRRPVQ